MKVSFYITWNFYVQQADVRITLQTAYKFRVVKYENFMATSVPESSPSVPESSLLHNFIYLQCNGLV
jgi:hypothetical protein